MPPTSKAPALWGRTCHSGTRVAQYRSTIQIRNVQIAASPSANVDIPASETSTSSAATLDATFDIIAASEPLLSVSLSPSQNLYTRRGTLVGVGGKADNAVSTLSILEPLRRAALRIPFLYQRIASPTPITALISAKSSSTSLAVVHLDGSLDWMLAGKALLAWTGQTLSVRPTVNRSMSLAHWGNSEVTGRGLLALSGRGSICELVLKPGEDYVAHPSNVVAYTMNATPPSPYRLKSTSLRFQVPRLDVSGWIPDTKFFRVMRGSPTWLNIKKLLYTLRTWSRRTIWGDRLFLQFHGPTTILVQTRAARLNDVFSNRDVNEVADVAPGTSVMNLLPKTAESEDLPSEKTAPPSNVQRTRMTTASVGPDGKVKFESAKETESLTR